MRLTLNGEIWKLSFRHLSGEAAGERALENHPTIRRFVERLEKHLGTLKGEKWEKCVASMTDALERLSWKIEDCTTHVTTAFLRKIEGEALPDLEGWETLRKEGKLFIGDAFCSISDLFTKEKGRRIALERALETFPRALRKEVWKQYDARGRKEVVQ